MAVGSYRSTVETLDALFDNVEAEYQRLDTKQDITEDEEAYLAQLKHARNLIDLLGDLILTAP
jgi:hypothetical protein